MLGDNKLLVVSVAGRTLVKTIDVAQRAEVNRPAVDSDLGLPRVVHGAYIRLLYQYVVGP